MAKSYVTRELDSTGDEICTHQTTGGEEVPSAILTDDENNRLIGQQTKANSLPVTLPSDADDVPVTIVDAAGDSCMDDVNDALQVNVVAGAAGGVSHVDDTPFTPGTSDLVPAGGMFDDVSPDLVDEGDAGVVRMSDRRELYAQIRDAAGNERGLNVDANGNIGVTDGGAALTVDGTVTADAGTGPWPVTDNAGSLSVDDGGTPLEVQGDVAEDAAVGGNPVLVGGRYDATPRTLDDGDAGAVALDADGAVQVSDGGNALTVDGTVSVEGGNTSDVKVTLDQETVDLTRTALTTISGTKSSSGDNQLVAAPGATTYIYVVSFTIQNESSVATTMTLRSGTTSNGWRWLGHSQGDGLSKDFPIARPWRLNANEALNLNLSGANSCGYSVMYYVGAQAA